MIATDILSAELDLTQTRREIDALIQAYNKEPTEKNAVPIYQRMSAIAAAYKAKGGPFSSPEDRYTFDLFAGTKTIPEVTATDFTAERLASAILFHGSLIVRGLFNEAAVEFLMDGMRYTEAQDLYTDNGPYAQMHLLQLLQVYKSSGLCDVITEYQGGDAVMKAERARINRRDTDQSLKGFGLPWHQDMPFFGSRCYAINCWSALTDLGGDNIGLKVLPRKLTEAIGWTKGSEVAFDYSKISRKKIQAVIDQEIVVKPVLKAGDVILFDELTLHATNPPKADFGLRYNASSWFFHWSNIPDGKIPLGF